MATLKILMAADERLKKVAQKVEKVDLSVQKIMDDMLETMYKTNGIGLAATQVNIHQRIVVMDISFDENGNGKKPMYFINPEITKRGKELNVYQEGCLSLPNIFDDVERPATCTVKALDYNGKAFTLECDGLLATCIQHEVDHLDGIIFADHLSRLKRNRILTKLQKCKKRKEYSQEIFNY
ncbi:MAG TPA: peptide deformylase [Alphaproteobacteria bacterium]|nr:peptide deformylase [Alphaproteobacteria bacterium]